MPLTKQHNPSETPKRLRAKRIKVGPNGEKIRVFKPGNAENCVFDLHQFWAAPRRKLFRVSCKPMDPSFDD